MAWGEEGWHAASKSHHQVLYKDNVWTSRCCMALRFLFEVDIVRYLSRTHLIAPPPLLKPPGTCFACEESLEIPLHLAASRNHAFRMSFSLVVIAPLRRVARLWGMRWLPLLSGSILGTSLEVWGVLFLLPLSESMHMLRGEKISFPLALLMLLGDKAYSSKSPNGL